MTLAWDNCLRLSCILLPLQVLLNTLIAPFTSPPSSPSSPLSPTLYPFLCPLLPFSSLSHRRRPAQIRTFIRTQWHFQRSGLEPWWARREVRGLVPFNTPRWEYEAVRCASQSREPSTQSGRELSPPGVAPQGTPSGRLLQVVFLAPSSQSLSLSLLT